MPSATPALTKDIAGLATMFATSGVTHLVRPQVFEPIIPTPLKPHKRSLVLVSGVVELACAAGLLYPPTRKVAGLASAVLLVGILPANVQMSVTHGKRAARKQDLGSRAFFAGTVARLPLQWPLIRTALRASGRIG
jgi:uncharacterized membrane protein